MSAAGLGFVTAAALTAVCSFGLSRRGRVGAAASGGGATVFLGLGAGMVCAATWSSGAGGPGLTGTLTLLGLLLAPYLLGLHDDHTDSSPRLRLVLLAAIAAGAWTLGFRVEGLALPGQVVLELGSLGPAATVLWIVGVTVSFDFIDGMDGLAGGLGLVACAGLVAIAAPGPGSWAAACVAGALVGFLLFNLPPARVILGNNGSNLVGFALALVSIQCASSPGGQLELVPAALFVAVPLSDSALTLLRRGALGHGLFRSDLGHLHHRLLRSGRGPNQALALLVGSAAVCAFGGSLVHVSGRLTGASGSASSSVFLGAGLAISLAAVLRVLRATGWLRLAGLGELARGPEAAPKTEAEPGQQAASPG